MKIKALLISLVVVPALVGPVGASPQAQQVSFSIATTLTAGKTYTFRFSLFDSGKIGSGTEFWRETTAYKVPNSKTITHNLGSVVPFSEGMHGANPNVEPVPVDFTQQFWVEVSTTGFRKRVKLNAVPYAIATAGLRVEQNATSPNLIGGNPGNDVSPGVIGATIGGGGEPNPGDPASPLFNKVLGNFGTVGGGENNQAGDRAVVAGGWRNQATGFVSVVAGGESNLATGSESSILGGCGNAASGDGSAVLGGCSNKATGYRGFALGEDANASRSGMFVWSATDDQDPDGGSDGRYSRVYEDFGGFPEATLDGTTPNPLLKDMQFWVKSPGGVFFVTGQDDTGSPLGVRLAQGSQQWEEITPPASDVTVKRDFAGIDATAVLQLVAKLPLMTWSYKSERGEKRHLGPTAQDFFASFGIGEDNRHISPLDGAGVSLAAIQGLYTLVLDLQRRLAEHEKDLQASRAESAALRARFEHGGAGGPSSSPAP